MRLLYTLVLHLLLPFALLRLALRGFRAPAYWRGIGQRFGWAKAADQRQTLWVHAVSVGEVQAALPLLTALRQSHPQARLLVTTTTPTGAQRLREALGNTVSHVYFPYDLPWAINLFLHRQRPAVAIIMETEIWPNLAYACARRDIPLILANARLSARSAAGYAKIRPLVAPALARFSLIAAQTEADAARLRDLGAPAERLHVTGSIKFDLHIPASVRESAEALRLSWRQRPAWIAASTREHEEKAILEAFASVRERIPQTLLVLVPRHPERFSSVAALCQAQGYTIARRSRGEPCLAATDIYLGDTMGELPLLYAAVDAAFIGGSLQPLGGHNPLEAAALGKPLLFGPHTFNFAEICQRLLAQGAARRINDSAELAAVLKEWLQDAPRREAVGEQGRLFVEHNRGALQRLLHLLEPYL